MTPKKLTELEGAVLGAIWILQPCTAYAVRVAFRDSPTARWSASAGAIYPLVKRLAAAGLLRGTVSSRGKRQSVRYQLTDDGVAALTSWVGPPLSETAASIPDDPLRARLRFLSVLAPEHRRRVVDEAVTATRAQVARLEEIVAEARQGDDPFWPLAAEGALAVARAREAWALRISEHLDRQPTGS